MSTTSSTRRTSGRGAQTSDETAKRPPFTGGRGAPLRTRPRSRGLIAGAAVLVLLFGLATAYAVSTAGQKVSVLTIGNPVAKGQVLERDALVSTTVSGVPGAIPVDQAPQVIGKTAAVDLVAGQVLTESMVTAEPTPGEGQAVVGLALEPTKVPAAGLEPGDLVQVIRVAGADKAPTSTNLASETTPETGEVGTVLSDAATVYEVGGDAAGGSEVLLTLMLPQADAVEVAAASTAGQAAVIEISPSTSTGGS